MNSEQLKAFCMAARTLSFTETSKILSVSQPAVSRQIATLEEEIGALLFKRGHNTLVLTRAGALLYEELPQRLSELEKILFNVRLVDLGKIHRIKLGVLRDQCMDAHLLDVCRSMRRDNYFIRIQQYDFHDIENAIFRNDIDAAVCIRWVPSAFSNCSSLIYSKEPVCLAVNTEFSPLIPSEITPDSLKDFSAERPTMVPETNCFPKKQFREVSKNYSRLWRGITEEDTNLVIPMVQSGIGSALVNASHILSTDSSVLFKEIDFLKPFDKGVFYLSENTNDAVKDFVGRMERRSIS